MQNIQPLHHERESRTDRRCDSKARGKPNCRHPFDHSQEGHSRTHLYISRQMKPHALQTNTTHNDAPRQVCCQDSPSAMRPSSRCTDRVTTSYPGETAVPRVRGNPHSCVPPQKRRPPPSHVHQSSWLASSRALWTSGTESTKPEANGIATAEESSTPRIQRHLHRVRINTSRACLTRSHTSYTSA